jgi:hypothetical protein
MKAFPSSEAIYGNNVVGVKENSGMDLRDYFAAQAMKHMGLPLKGSRGDSCWNLNEMDEFPYDGYANVAYKFADAMMKAREK